MMISMEASFTLFTIFFLFVFGIILFSIIYSFGKHVKEKKKNDNSPILDINATAVDKREKINGGQHCQVQVRYYVTFEFDNGERCELEVKSYDYSMIVKGDEGTLSFQGTRFLSFDRYKKIR
ncbi:MAG: DUF2500 domain-containing protein [Bacilli bacterium]|nr:DUF2500 domain-containing protein [Bacilli bacterium]